MRYLIVLGAAMSLATPAFAQAVDQDVKCLLASNVFARVEKDPARKTVASAATLYYYGRVDGKLTPAQLKTAILAQNKSLTAANLGQTMTACAQRLQERQKVLQSVGQDVAASQPKAPALPQ